MFPLFIKNYYSLIVHNIHIHWSLKKLCILHWMTFTSFITELMRRYRGKWNHFVDIYSSKNIFFYINKIYYKYLKEKKNFLIFISISLNRITSFQRPWWLIVPIFWKFTSFWFGLLYVVASSSQHRDDIILFFTIGKCLSKNN